MQHSLRVALLLVILAASVSGLEIPTQSVGAPIGALPPHLRFAQGEFSLIVDPTAVRGNMIALYLVNDTAREAPLRRGLILARETLGADGVWRRCSSLPNMDECGMERRTMLEPGSFIQLEYPVHSRSGVIQKTRLRYYSLEGPLNDVSNEFTALVDEQDLLSAQFDLISAASGPLEDIARIAFNAAPIPINDPIRRSFAEDQLRKHANQGGYAELMQRFIATAKQENRSEMYVKALTALAFAPSREDGMDAFWTTALADIHSTGKPWDGLALNVVIATRFSVDSPGEERKRSLLKTIASNPKHGLLTEAITAYAKVEAPAKVMELLRHIANSRRYPIAARTEARALLERLSNPSSPAGAQ